MKKFIDLFVYKAYMADFSFCLQDYHLLELLCSFCICEGIALTENQNTIARYLFIDHKVSLECSVRCGLFVLCAQGSVKGHLHTRAAQWQAK